MGGLLTRIEQHLRQTGMPPTMFGRLAARDPRLVLDMRNGRQPRAKMAERLDAFLRSSERAQ